MLKLHDIADCYTIFLFRFYYFIFLRNILIDNLKNSQYFNQLF